MDVHYQWQITREGLITWSQFHELFRAFWTAGWAEWAGRLWNPRWIRNRAQILSVCWLQKLFLRFSECSYCWGTNSWILRLFLFLFLLFSIFVTASLTRIRPRWYLGTRLDFAKEWKLLYTQKYTDRHNYITLLCFQRRTTKGVAGRETVTYYLTFLSHIHQKKYHIGYSADMWGVTVFKSNGKELQVEPSWTWNAW